MDLHLSHVIPNTLSHTYVVWGFPFEIMQLIFYRQILVVSSQDLSLEPLKFFQKYCQANLSLSPI